MEHLRGFLGKLRRRSTENLASLRRRVSTRLGINIRYRLGNFSITLPAEHLLPLYRERYRQYDAFLPVLAKFLVAGSTVVDVGANCGDTVAAMISENISLRYICVEPDPVFFRFLTENARLIKQEDERASITLVQSLIGKKVTTAALAGSGGSKHAVPGSDITTNAHRSVTLDGLMTDIGGGNVILLKSDVDGYDYDVLDSADALITEQQPILFFECQFASHQEMSFYETTIRSLSMKGYLSFTVFDNFGAVVMTSANADSLLELFDYVMRQNVTGSNVTRTIFYFDVATATAKHGSTLSKALSVYLNEAPRQRGA